MQMCHSLTHSLTHSSERDAILKKKLHISTIEEIRQKQRTFVAIQYNKYLVLQNIYLFNTTRNM